MSMTAWVILLAVIVGIAVWLYNSLVELRNQVRNAWAQIDVQLKRRHDLIPNLVEAVKGYMQHEREVLQRVTEARSRAMAASGAAQAGAAEGQLSQAVAGLLAVMERYPDLKANQNVLALQEEIVSTENRIGFARQLYNDMVARYNTRQQVFPVNLAAAALGFAPAEFFQMDAAERAVPRVDLSPR
ncbi:MAG TPA: LemA family protein [Methylomirabilota bacterium]|jgi:LemA protein|nr:LemA family protein [Methylomirabilota bacterium]